MSRLESINISRGGVPKRAVFEAFVSESGVDGDRQGHPGIHGGPDRAVVLFSLDVIRALQAEGHPIAPGTTGENFTVSGVDWASLAPGDVLQVGGVRLQITTFAAPCASIRSSFLNGDIHRISQKRHPGFSRLTARVLEAGLVRPGDAVEVT